MASSAPLVRFKAGRCKREGKTVTPLEERGVIEMGEQDDGLMHFVWKARDGKLGLDFILFEGDARFRRISKVNDGRVFLLEWVTGDQKEFFWMQEPSDDNDEDILEKINGYLKPPPLASSAQAPAASSKPAATPAAAAAAPATPAASAASSAAAPSAPKKASTATAGSANNSNLVSEAFLSGLLSQMPAAQTGKGPRLHEVLDSQALQRILVADHALCEALFPLLPEVDRSVPKLVAFLSSPQFQQAVQTFNAAVVQGHGQALLRQIVGNVNNLEQVRDVTGFLRVIQKHLEGKKQ